MENDTTQVEIFKGLTLTYTLAAALEDANDEQKAKLAKAFSPAAIKYYHDTQDINPLMSHIEAIMPLSWKPSGENAANLQKLSQVFQLNGDLTAEFEVHPDGLLTTS